MLKAITILLFCSLISSAQAEVLKLLEIPLEDGTFFTYTVDTKYECSFKGVLEVEVPSFEQAKKQNILLTKINFFQKKLNLEIEEQEVTDDRIIFSLTGSTNIFFEYFFKKSETTPSCNLVKVMHINDKKYNMDHLEIDYSNFLKSPAIQKITVKDEFNQDSDVYLYPWQLRGQISIYELSIGPALNIHSNIRINNKNAFERTDPVIQPIPGFFFRYGPFFINKNGVGSLLFHKGELSILGMGLLEGEPYSTPGLQEREQGIFAGSIIKYDYVELTYYKDFIQDKGYNLKLNIAPEFFYKISWKFTPQVFVQYWDNDYVDYYFGVRPEESKVSRFRNHRGTHTMNYGAMFETMHFVKKWTFVNTVGAKFYGEEVYNSPTVTKKVEWRFILSALYKVF
jgi:hypothetical protein